MHKQADKFTNRLGFIVTTAGSAIGLANVWRFPFLVGTLGGGSLTITYLLLLLLAGLPLFLAEIFIGKSTNCGAYEASYKLGKTAFWAFTGKLSVCTAFLISSFYSVVAGWCVGYFFLSLSSPLPSNPSEAHFLWITFVTSPVKTILCHFIFLLTSFLFVRNRVQSGIERCSRIFMPLFLLTLLGLTIQAAFTADAADTLKLLFIPQQPLHQLAILTALGHAFFTLSVGQGTLVTYGSYLPTKKPLATTSLIVVAADTIVSLCSAFTILAFILATGGVITSGPSLVFETLPQIFNKIALGSYLAPLFFFFIFIAALTSMVSALEPPIQALMNIMKPLQHTASNSHQQRRKAAQIICCSSFVLGIPSALSLSFLDAMSFVTTALFIPFIAVTNALLVGWKADHRHLHDFLFNKQTCLSDLMTRALVRILRYVVPVGIFFVFATELGVI